MIHDSVGTECGRFKGLRVNDYEWKRRLQMILKDDIICMQHLNRQKGLFSVSKYKLDVTA